MQDFIIDQVSWHTRALRNYVFDDAIVYIYFENILKYLDENNLLVKPGRQEIRTVTEETCIRRSDLTDTGFKLFQKAYGKWTDNVVDKKIKPDDFRMLDRQLKKIRESE